MNEFQVSIRERAEVAQFYDDLPQSRIDELFDALHG